jgi:hypothetical protein
MNIRLTYQNRRQTFRKQIQQNAIPQGSDPADYSDLQKSPRSRRLSLEAANAVAMEERARGIHLTASSSSSSSSYAPRRQLGSVPPRGSSDHLGEESLLR